jgi:hypothetical protein
VSAQIGHEDPRFTLKVEATPRARSEPWQSCPSRRLVGSARSPWFPGTVVSGRFRRTWAQEPNLCPNGVAGESAAALSGAALFPLSFRVKPELARNQARQSLLGLSQTAILFGRDQGPGFGGFRSGEVI